MDWFREDVSHLPTLTVPEGLADHSGAANDMISRATADLIERIVGDDVVAGIARALYEQFVESDFPNEYCGWDALQGKQEWIERAQAIVEHIRKVAGDEGRSTG